MTFDVSADAYGLFMGRFSEPLALDFLALGDVRPGQRALDVGCGPGALTAELVDRLGAKHVAAIDPSESFVAAVRERWPEVDVQVGGAEGLPYPDGSFDRVFAQLVVHFMTDPVAGLREMGRVAKPGGIVAASVWDHGGGNGPLSTFWRAVHLDDPDAVDGSDRPGAHEGDLTTICVAAGLRDVVESALTVTIQLASFDAWWHPFTLGVGPAGDYVQRLDEDERARLRERCVGLLPPAPFALTVSAWCVLARR